MRFFDFEEKMKNYPVFTAKELAAIFPKQENFSSQLSFWRKKGYIKKIEKGLYMLSSKKDEIDPMELSAKIYSPSYLSLEFALNHYGVIPDIPGTYTSVSTRKTKYFENNFGNYSYQKIKKELFFGYQTFSNKGVSFNIATPEKAILDYIYLNKDKFVADFDFWREMRIDEDFAFKKRIIEEYKDIYRNKKVNKLIDNLLAYQKNDR